jgi:hypothetical protein
VRLFIARTTGAIEVTGTTRSEERARDMRRSGGRAVVCEVLDIDGVALPGASHAKTKSELGWRPAHPSWRQGLRGLARGLGPARDRRLRGSKHHDGGYDRANLCC